MRQQRSIPAPSCGDRLDFLARQRGLQRRGPSSRGLRPEGKAAHSAGWPVQHVGALGAFDRCAVVLAVGRYLPPDLSEVASWAHERTRECWSRAWQHHASRRGTSDGCVGWKRLLSCATRYGLQLRLEYGARADRPMAACRLRALATTLPRCHRQTLDASKDSATSATMSAHGSQSVVPLLLHLPASYFYMGRRCCLATPHHKPVGPRTGDP